MPIKDTASADDLFRILMGDHVEPRREFIESTRWKCGIWMYSAQQHAHHSAAVSASLPHRGA